MPSSLLEILNLTRRELLRFLSDAESVFVMNQLYQSTWNAQVTNLGTLMKGSALFAEGRGLPKCPGSNQGTVMTFPG